MDVDGPIVGQSLTFSAPSGVGGLDKTKSNGVVLVDFWTPRLYACNKAGRNWAHHSWSSATY